MKPQITKLTLSLATILTLGATSVQAENLLQNGSFEEYSVLKSKRAWKQVNLAHWNEVTKVNLAAPKASDGKAKVALDSNKKENTLTQTISTIEGGVYTFSVDAYTSKRNKSSSDFEMIVDGELIETFTPTTEWKTYSVTFEGNGEEQTIGFRELTSQNNNKGVFLDNAQLSVKVAEKLVDLAQEYGKATQGAIPDYASEHTPEMGIDGNDTSYIYTGTRDDSWYQVELPKNASISKIVVKNSSYRTDHLSGARVYLSNNPYNGDVSGMEFVGRLSSETEEQVFSFDNPKNFSYVVVKNYENLHFTTLSAFGELVNKPVVDENSEKADIAHLYGEAKSGSTYGNSYTAYNAIDNNSKTHFLSQKDSATNWLDIKLPKDSKIESIEIDNFSSTSWGNLLGAKLYVLDEEYNATSVNLDDHTPVATLSDETNQKIVVNRVGSHVLIKGEGNNALYLKDVKVYNSSAVESYAGVDLANKYGVATQGTQKGYRHYQPPVNVIDGDIYTWNHTDGGKWGYNWLQIQLPSPTTLKKLVVQNGNYNSSNLDYIKQRIGGAKVYLSSTPYHTGDALPEDSKLITTLKATNDPQIIKIDGEKKGTYLLIKGAYSEDNNKHIHFRRVELYGAIPQEPTFDNADLNISIDKWQGKAESIYDVNSTDYQEDMIGYSIDGTLPFSIDNAGHIYVTSTLDTGVYTLPVVVSDGTHSQTREVRVNVTETPKVKKVFEVKDKTPTLTGYLPNTYSDGDSVKVIIDGVEYEAEVNSDGTWTLDGSELESLGLGKHDLTLDVNGEQITYTDYVDIYGDRFVSATESLIMDNIGTQDVNITSSKNVYPDKEESFRGSSIELKVEDGVTKVINKSYKVYKSILAKYTNSEGKEVFKELTFNKAIKPHTTNTVAHFANDDKFEVVNTAGLLDLEVRFGGFGYNGKYCTEEILQEQRGLVYCMPLHKGQDERKYTGTSREVTEQQEAYNTLMGTYNNFYNSVDAYPAMMSWAKMESFKGMDLVTWNTKYYMDNLNAHNAEDYVSKNFYEAVLPNDRLRMTILQNDGGVYGRGNGKWSSLFGVDEVPNDGYVTMADWAMDKNFDTYMYNAVHHEMMHGKGYQHDSGMTYGWSTLLGKIFVSDDIYDRYQLHVNPETIVPNYVFTTKKLGNHKVQVTLHKKAEATSEDITFEVLSSAELIGDDIKIEKRAEDGNNQVTISVNPNIKTRLIIRAYGEDSFEVMSEFVTLD